MTLHIVGAASYLEQMHLQILAREPSLGVDTRRASLGRAASRVSIRTIIAALIPQVMRGMKMARLLVHHYEQATLCQVLCKVDMPYLRGVPSARHP